MAAWLKCFIFHLKSDLRDNVNDCWWMCEDFSKAQRTFSVEIGGSLAPTSLKMLKKTKKTKRKSQVSVRQGLCVNPVLPPSGGANSAAIGSPQAGTVAPWMWNSPPGRTAGTRTWASRRPPSSSRASSSRAGSPGSPGDKACGILAPPAPAPPGSPYLQEREGALVTFQGFGIKKKEDTTRGPFRTNDCSGMKRSGKSWQDGWEGQ